MCDSGSAISDDLCNCGDQSSLLEQQEANIDEKVLGDVELGGVERSSLAILKG